MAAAPRPMRPERMSASSLVLAASTSPGVSSLCGLSTKRPSASRNERSGTFLIGNETQFWGCPEDEYDTYASKIAATIRDGADDNELMRYLERAEVKYIGLGPPFDAARGRKVAPALRLLGPPKSK